MASNMHSCHSTETMPWLVISVYWPIHFTTVPSRLTEIFLQSMDSKTWEGSRCRHHVDFSKWANKRPVIHPLARPKTRSFCTFRNLSFDQSTTEDKPLYLTSFTGKKSSQSQGKEHCQLLPKDWKTASHALTSDPLAPQQPPVAMGRHYAYAPLAKELCDLNGRNWTTIPPLRTCAQDTEKRSRKSQSPESYLYQPKHLPQPRRFSNWSNAIEICVHHPGYLQKIHQVFTKQSFFWFWWDFISPSYRSWRWSGRTAHNTFQLVVAQ